MNEPVTPTQYMVFYDHQTESGSVMTAVEAHFVTLDEATAVAQQYGRWQILEMAAAIVATSEDTK